MQKEEFCNELLQPLLALLPKVSGLDEQELRERFRGVVNDTLSRLELVTQAEFDAQAKVLARTREKLEALEVKVSELEKNTPQP